MNDDGPSAAAASSSRVAFDVTVDGTLRDEAPTAAQMEERRKNNRDMFNKKRVQLLDDLIYNLDLLVYSQLSAIYYMESVLMEISRSCDILLTLGEAVRFSDSCSAHSHSSSYSRLSPRLLYSLQTSSRL